MSQPVTFLDSLKGDRELFHSLKETISFIDRMRLTGPVSDCSRFLHFQTYRNLTVGTWVSDFQYKTNRWNPSDPLVRIEHQRADMVCHALFGSFLNFTLFGEKTFFFSDNLVDHLSQTELNAPASLLRLPFKACHFVYQAEVMKEAIDFQGEMIKQGIDNVRNPISIFATEFSEGEGRRIVFVAFQDIGLVHPLMIKRSLLLTPPAEIKEDWTVDDALKTNWSESYDTSKMDGDDLIFREGKLLMFFRVLVNGILYLSSNDPDIQKIISPHTKTQKRKKSRKNRTRIGNGESFVVGAGIRPIVVVKPSEIENSDSEIARLRRAIRFMVRGHWRNQACGMELSERRLIWIKPYYKGPEMAELINKPYQVS